MDNGRTNAIFSNSESNNPTQLDSLDEKDWQRSLEISTPADMPTPEVLQEKANDFFEADSNAEPSLKGAEQLSEPSTTSPVEQPADPQALGQIVSFPGANTPSSSSATKVYNPANIKTEGDYLDKASLIEIEKLEDKLSQDGNLSSFYDDTRDLTEVNLNNSFNRNLYNEQNNDIGKAA